MLLLQDDCQGLAGFTRPPAHFCVGILVMLEELCHLDGLVDEFCRPSVEGAVLEEQGSGMGGAASGQDLWKSISNDVPGSRLRRGVVRGDASDVVRSSGFNHLDCFGTNVRSSWAHSSSVSRVEEERCFV